MEKGATLPGNANVWRKADKAKREGRELEFEERFHTAEELGITADALLALDKQVEVATYMLGDELFVVATKTSYDLYKE